jgi:hypothetical protein
MVEHVEETTKKRDERRAEAAPHLARYSRTAGVLLSVAGAVILMGIITGEALYPAPYNTAANTLSDLGGTMPSEGGTVLQRSATIFDATMILTGAMIIIGAYFVHRTFKRWAATVSLALLGTGVMGTVAPDLRSACLRVRRYSSRDGLQSYGTAVSIRLGGFGCDHAG